MKKFYKLMIFILVFLIGTINLFGQEKNYLYTKKNLAVVVNDLENKKVIEKISIRTRVEFLEKKELVIVKIKKVKEGEKEVEKRTEKIENWKKIKYIRNFKERVGWIREEELTNDYKSTLKKSWKNIEYNNFPEKKEFLSNKKIDVKGIYVSAIAFSSEKKLDSLIKLANETDINAFVIDVKDDFGDLLWKMDDSILEHNPLAHKKYKIKNIEKYMKKLKDNNIYAIARIVSFKDPTYAKSHPEKVIRKKNSSEAYTNADKVLWISPYDTGLWEYNIAVSKEAAKVGFNEVQFDYVRFPATGGGNADKNIYYPEQTEEAKPVIIQKYLKYAFENLQESNIYLSADVYGQIGTFNDDMALGQYWEAISGYVNTISPMMYPSHYARNSYGVKIPDAEPYKIIYKSTLDSINRNSNIDNPSNIRPWIQAFTAKWVKGYIPYGKKEIDAQIKALKDLGINEFLLWNPANNYNSYGNDELSK